MIYYCNGFMKKAKYTFNTRFLPSDMLRFTHDHTRNHTKVHIMRTNIDIDDNLMADALRLTGISTKREVVELALRTLLRMHRQKEIRDLRGKLHWQGELDEMRNDK